MDERQRLKQAMERALGVVARREPDQAAAVLQQVRSRLETVAVDLEQAGLDRAAFVQMSIHQCLPGDHPFSLS